MTFELLPPPPEFAPEEYEACIQRGSALPMIIQWYRYLAEVCRRVASVDPTAPYLLNVNPVHVGVLVGLLNRCSRVMTAVLSLVGTGQFGDSIRALDRNVCETAARLWWLAKENRREEFVSYLAWGLRSELEMKDQILANIAERGGRHLVIEDRMLASIDQTLAVAGLSEAEVRATQKPLDLASIVRKLGLPRGLYTVTYKFGSHAVHGTWTDLFFHHLEPMGDLFVPAQRDIPVDENDLRMTSIFISDALRAFMTFLLGEHEPEFCLEFRQLCDDVVEELVRVQVLTSGNDFETSEPG